MLLLAEGLGTDGCDSTIMGNGSWVTRLSVLEEVKLQLQLQLVRVRVGKAHCIVC